MATTTIAVLGATGKTGRGIVKELLANTSANVNIYVRSLRKLAGLFPDISSNPRISVFEGSIQDADLMTKCLSGASTIIFTLGENDNRRGVTVIEDGARTVLSALQTLSEHLGDRDWKKPRVILLSSSTWNPRFAAARPALVHLAIKTAFTHPYADLCKGQALFLESTSLCNPLLVQPGGLVQDVASGYEISTETVRLACSYADLATGFVELATTPAYDALNAVGISSRDGDNYLRHQPLLAFWIVKGLCAQFIPGFWPVYDTMASWTGWLVGKT